MLLIRSRQAADWISRLIARAKSGDLLALAMADYVYSELRYLQNLKDVPLEDTATLRQIVQSRKYQLWRVSHPFDPMVAMRTVVWFDPDRKETLLIVLAQDKKHLGNLFYNSIGDRADQIIEEYKRERDRYAN